MNFFTTTYRHLKKRKAYTLLEICSLTIGMVCVLLSLLYLKRETSFDRSFANHERIFRVNHLEESSGNRYSGTPSALGFHANQEIPQAKEVVRVFYPYRMFSTEALVERNTDIRFYEDNLIEADSNFFRVFDFHFAEGNAAQALKAPDAIVLSKKAALRYFGSEPALNQTLKIDNGRPLRITGVVEVPDNTHLDFEFLRPAHHDPAQLYEWEHTLAFTYLLLHDGNDADKAARQLYDIVLRNAGSHRIEYLKNYRHRLQPITEIHTSVLEWDIIEAVPAAQLRVIGLIALAILLLAAVNFVNLATARASERAKEVGISKLLGGGKGMLMRRYFSEALLLSSIAGAAGLGFAHAAIPYFNQLADTRISLADMATWQMALAFVALLLLTGLMAGIYPAYVLTRMTPLGLTRQGQQGRRDNSVRVRQGLVVLQFAITGILLIGTFTVHRQLRFMQEKDLGYEQDQVLVLRVQQPSRQLFETLRNEMRAQNSVLKIASASTVMGASTGSATFATPEMPDETPANFAKTIAISAEFLDLMGIPLLQGNTFREDGADTLQYFIVNETLAKRFQLSDPLSATFGWHGEPPGKIIGVMKDFHFISVAYDINPLVMYVTPRSSYRYIFLKISGENIPTTLAAVEAAWNKHVSDFPLDYFFQDAHFQRVYARQEQVHRIASLFSGIAMTLAILGLLGLSAYMVAQRTKEIGIRKVLGASVAGITGLLAKDFLKLVFVAIVIASPVAWYFMDKWLADFAYRIEIQWWMFAGAGVLAVAIAFLTVSFQSVRAALANPVKSLRSE
jgi:putative ABC transport system permease protein